MISPIKCRMVSMVMRSQLLGYRHSGSTAAAGTVKSQREGSKRRVQESPETNRPWTANVCSGQWLLSAIGGKGHHHIVL